MSMEKLESNYAGFIKFGDVEIFSCVLNDWERVLSQREVVKLYKKMIYDN